MSLVLTISVLPMSVPVRRKITRSRRWAGVAGRSHGLPAEISLRRLTG